MASLTLSKPAATDPVKPQGMPNACFNASASVFRGPFPALPFFRCCSRPSVGGRRSPRTTPGEGPPLFSRDEAEQGARRCLQEEAATGEAGAASSHGPEVAATPARVPSEPTPMRCDGQRGRPPPTAGQPPGTAVQPRRSRHRGRADITAPAPAASPAASPLDRPGPARRSRPTTAHPRPRPRFGAPTERAGSRSPQRRPQLPRAPAGHLSPLCQGEPPHPALPCPRSGHRGAAAAPRRPEGSPAPLSAELPGPPPRQPPSRSRPRPRTARRAPTAGPGPNGPRRCAPLRRAPPSRAAPRRVH